MIIEALIGGVTVCFVASLSFAKWSVKRLDRLNEPERPKEDAKERRARASKRDDLKMAIEEWHQKAQTLSAEARIKELEQQLFELDD